MPAHETFDPRLHLLAVLIFHQSLWYVLNLVGLIPLDRPAWPLDRRLRG